MDWIERKPVWINGEKVFVFPWALAWDALLAVPENDFRDVWTGKAFLADEAGNRVSPDDGLRTEQRLYIIRNREFSAA